MSFTFTDHTTVETLDVVPEEYRPFYQEGEGGYVLSDSVKPLAVAYDGQTKALTDARAHHKKLNEENAARRNAVKAFESVLDDLGVEGEDRVEALREYIGDLTSKVKGGEEMRVNLDKVRQESERRITEAVAKKDEEAAFLRRSIERYMVDQAATEALSREKGSVRLMLPVIKDHVKVVQDGEEFVVRVVDAQGDFRPDGRGGWMSLSDLVKELKGNPEYARAFDSEAPSGTGSSPGAMKRPAPAPQAEKSSVDKISAGLQRMGRR